jgi:hypothetical protein
VLGEPGPETARPAHGRHELDTAVEIGRRKHRLALDRVRVRQTQAKHGVELVDGHVDLILTHDQLDTVESENAHSLPLSIECQPTVT